MQDDIQFDVQGLDDVLTAFNYLNAIIDKSEVKAGLKDASRMLMEKGKSNLRLRMKSGPNGVTGNLMRAFRYKLKRKNSGSLIGFNYGKGGGPHAHLVDRGTKDRTTRQGYNRGHIQGNRFWSDVSANEYDRAMNMVARAIQSAIAKI